RPPGEGNGGDAHVDTARERIGVEVLQLVLPSALQRGVPARTTRTADRCWWWICDGLAHGAEREGQYEEANRRTRFSHHSPPPFSNRTPLPVSRSSVEKRPRQEQDGAYRAFQIDERKVHGCRASGDEDDGFRGVAQYFQLVTSAPGGARRSMCAAISGSRRWLNVKRLTDVGT